jgi:hypothetical protein
MILPVEVVKSWMTLPSSVQLFQLQHAFSFLIF